jgi:hypothetical protein
MALKDFLIEEACKQFNAPLLEAINGLLAKTVAVLSARGDDDAGSAGLDFKRLADILTTLKIITDKELRGGITADDVGFNPNSVDDMYKVLTKVPDSPTASLPADVSKFFKETASLSNKIKGEQLKTLSKLVDKDPAVRAEALKSLKIVSTKIDQLYNKVKSTAKK